MLMKEVKAIKIANKFEIGGNKGRFTLLAGPCAIESEEMSIRVAGKIKEICERWGVPFEVV